MALILLVDDHPAMRSALRMWLERSGDEVVEAESASAALELLRLGTMPDAVVSDVRMPGMSGLQFYRELVILHPRLRDRVVFLTASKSDPVIQKVIADFGVSLVDKIGDPQRLVDAVRIAVLRAHE